MFLFLTIVGGLSSPVKGPYAEPLPVVTKLSDSSQLTNSSVDFDDKEHHLESAEKVITAGLKRQKLPSGPQTLISEPSHKWSDKISTVPELELRKLERGDVSVDDFLVVVVGSMLCVNSAHGVHVCVQTST